MNDSLEHQLQSVYDLDHEGCKAALMRIERPKLDFTLKYLDGLSVDRLRHLLAAVYYQSRHAMGRRQ